MKRILVPTDFSACAYKALDYAVCIAKKTGAEIVLMHACELVHNPFVDRMAMLEEYNRFFQEDRDGQLQDIKKSIEEEENIQISTKLYDGTVIESILTAEKKYHPDLIVMGSLGKTNFTNRIFGSKTAALVSESKIPVITIPYRYEWSEPKRILLTLNDPAESMSILQPVFAIADLFQSDVKAAIFTGSQEEAVEVVEHGHTIYSLQKKLLKFYNSRNVEPVHLSGHDFQAAVHEYIQTYKIDLLAMVTHKKNIIQNLFYKSMTKKMGYHTTIPLLSIHA